MFGNILKMLFFYKFFTFSQPFSQLPNKFYIRKFQNIHLTQPKIKIKIYSQHIHDIFVGEGARKSERLRERERSEWMEDGGGQIGWVWGWSGVGWWSVAASRGLKNGFAEWVRRSGGFVKVGLRNGFSRF